MSYADKPWLGSYMMGPYKLDKTLQPYPEVPLFSALDNAADKYPRQTAILFKERELKYKDLREQVDRLAAGLAGMGVKKGDRVCIYLPNCPEFILAEWAILKCGGVIVPVSILRTGTGLQHEVENSSSRVIFCRGNRLDTVLELKEKGLLEQVVVTSDEGYDQDFVKSPLPAGVHDFRIVLQENEPIAPGVEINPKEDLAILAFTGGATGIPKGVMLTHFNRYSNLRQGFPWIMKPMLKGIAGKASFFLPVPLFHAYGQYIAQSAINLGLRIILMPDPRDNEAIVEHIRKYRPLMIPAVPTQLMRIAESKVGRLNAIPMSGAAPLPDEVSERIKQEIGSPVSEGYGLTETGPLTHFNITPFSRITGFMAREKKGLGVPAPDTDCKLVDPESGEEVPFGETGEIVVRGPQIMKGYWPEPGSGLDKDGWLHTGDIGYMDEDGFFHLSDRIKDMVNVSGNKVYTTEVDDVLFRHPAVMVAAAFGIPDPDLPGNERVIAVIQLKKGQEHRIEAAEIQQYCREQLPPYAVPKQIKFVEDMPLTVTEKVFKKTLRDEAMADMSSESALNKN